MKGFTHICFVTCFVLSACASKPFVPTYGPTSEQGYGYSDKKTGENSYLVQVTGVDHATAIQYAERRARELCKFEPKSVDIKGHDSKVIVDAWRGSYIGTMTDPTEEHTMSFLTADVACH